MTTVTTVQGDTWDIIAKKHYGNELYMDKIIKANIKHRDTVIFSAGIVLELPEVDITSGDYEMNLPPWKRSTGGA